MSTPLISTETRKTSGPGLFFTAESSVAAAQFFAVDWSQTELGPIETWPSTLLQSVNTVFHFPFPMMIWWGDDCIQIHNEALRKIQENDWEGTAMGRSARTSWPRQWEEFSKAEVAHVKGTRTALHFENRHLRIPRGGEIVDTFWTYSVTPIFSMSGSVDGIMIFNLETTATLVAAKDLQNTHDEEQKKAQTRAEENESRLRIITDRLPAFVSYMDASGRYQFINRAYCNWFGIEREAIEGKTRSELVADESTYEYMRPYEIRAFAGEPVSFELTLYKPNGDFVHLDTEFLPDIDPETKRVRGIVGVGHDITERKRALVDSRLAQRELAIAKDAAETANATKSAFLANMSHEIRTPLGAILGFSELLKDPKITGDERDQYIHTITRNGQALTRIIDDILDLAKVEAGRLDIEEIDFSFYDLVNEVMDLFKGRASEKKITLACSIGPRVPNFISSDPTRIRQILINIVGNAIKFTDKGGVTLSIQSYEDGEGLSRINILVKDSGRGLTLEQKDRLFKPFTQADNTTTRQFGGTGLGLALSKRLCEALGGDITIGDFGLERGCEFIISFVVSLARKPETALKLPIAAKVEAPPPLVLDGLRILVVDDSPDNQFLLKRMLNKKGAEVELACDGIEAVEKALRMSFDIVLMDIQMPRMDGYEALKSLQEQAYDVPVVALTAHAMKEDRLKTEAAGFVGHLTKPLNPTELVPCIKLWAKRSH